jgi:hypothetical protein
MELVSLAERFACVENCTEEHFMELLEDTERLCQTKLNRKYKRLHTHKSEITVNY